MKKALTLFLFLSVLCSMSAQAQERDRLLDSLAYGTLNRMRFSIAVDHAVEATQIYTYRPVTEYAVFNNTYRRMAECFSVLTDGELRELLCYVTSRPYRTLMSVSFWDSFSMMLYDATDAAMGLFPEIDMDSGGDEYRNKVMQLIECMNLAPMMSSYVDVCRNNASFRFGHNSSHVTFLDKVSADVAGVMTQTMLDYFPVEDVDYLISFHDTDLSSKVKRLCDGNVVDFNYFLNFFLIDPYYQGMALSTVRNATGLYSRVRAIRDELAVDVDSVSKDEILDVALRIRSVPYPFADRYRVGTTLELGDVNYVGQVRDGQPHGEGTMLGKDGTRETGTFRYGQRNGFFSSYSADGVESVSVWAQGHLVEPQSVGRLPDGSVPSVPLVDGIPFGYGACMKGKDTYSGQFVDGRLNGYGTLISPGVTSYKSETVYAGLFRNDFLVKGTRVERLGLGERHFKGRILSEGVMEGEMIMYDTSGVMIRRYKGTVIEPHNLEGEGEDWFYSDSLKSVFKGIFIKGELYGNGTSARTVTLESGMVSELYTEGCFWRNLPYHISKRVETFTDIPVEAGKARVLRSCGVRVVTRGTRTLTVTCEGEFDGDLLKRGRVDVSDGTWMEGSFADGFQTDGTARAVDKYGTVYEGEVRDGKYHGKGKCTYRDGTWFVGNFSYGNRRGGTHYSSDGKVLKVLSD